MMRVSGVSAWLMTNRAACFAVALVAFGPRLVAQTPTVASVPPASSRTGKARIAGVAIDSLNARYLAGADIVIEGLDLSLHTDSVGHFAIDSLSPGTYQVGAFHPLLDTLRIALATPRFHVGPDSSSLVVIAVPSARTLVGRYCKTQSDSGAGSAVIGHVIDPQTLHGIADAQVSVAWSEIQISKEAGFRRTPHAANGVTDASGAFAICGLPNGLQATLQARLGAAITAEVPVSLGDRPVELVARTLFLPIPTFDSVVSTGDATLSGKVVLEGSPTNDGTEVELEGTDFTAMTNEKGEFTMRNLPSGSRMILVRHLGFAARTQPVNLSSREEEHVTIELPKFAALMDPVRVVARTSAALDKLGFHERQKLGAGYYLGPDRLQEINAVMLTDVLRWVPTLRVSYTPHGEVVSSSRGPGRGCVQYFLDDMPYQETIPGDINHIMRGDEVVGVEVYQAAQIPAQYVRPGPACTTVILWTRLKIGS
jgi:hypothetical protein